jgi:DNA-binding GntR family transcriptional regulator
MRSGITEALRIRIIDGTLPPGTRVSEEWVATEMGVSRGPVREAIRELENEGLLMVNPYRGTFVNEISTKELRQVLIPIRLILESRACTIALPNMTEANFQVIADIVKAMDAVATAGGDGALIKLVDLDVQYHHYLMSLSDQYHTMQLWKTIQPRIRVGFYRLGLRHTDFDEITIEHQILLDALRTRDIKILLPALEHHICTDQYRLLDRVEKEQG